MKEFKKYYTIKASPEEVYEALTHPGSIELWTGEPAEMSTEKGTEFSLWNGSIVGMNLEFDENKKIVQHWYFNDEKPDSIATIKLHPDKDGTSIELRHTYIPDEFYENIIQGWNEAYFGALKEFLED
ncbi:MAG: SRPBCC domain-containing protein [Flavobacteriales bacterium]